VSQRQPGTGESLIERYPGVAAEWHPDLNELTPADVKPGSNLRAWWRCSTCGHEWQAVVQNRALLASRCPECSPRIVSRKRTRAGLGESLVDVHPELSAEWHPVKNDPLTPRDVKPNRSLKIWWRCSTCGHEWQAMVRERAAGRGCFKCAARRRAAERAPMYLRRGRPLPAHLLAEWVTDLNDRDPSAMTGGSDYKAWWRCSTCGHEWQASVSNRVTHGSGCRVCAGRKRSEARSRPAPGQSLMDLYPELADQWDATRNGDLTPADIHPGTACKFWWLCLDCGRSYQTTPVSRTTRGSGCQSCSWLKRGQLRSMPPEGGSLADLRPEIAAEWHPTRNDPLRPEDVKAGSNRKVWWQCSEGHEWRTMVGSRTTGRRCPECLLHSTSAQQIRLAAELSALGFPVSDRHRPIEVAGRRPVRADIVLADWKLVIELDGAFWHADQIEADITQTRALIDAGWRVLRLREGDLPGLNVGELHARVPSYADAYTLACAVIDRLARVGLTVPGVEEYRAAGKPIATRESDAQIRMPREVSVASEFPDVAAEWHPTKNTTTADRVPPFSNEKAWFRCGTCGCEWESIISNRTNLGQGCPPCGCIRQGVKRATPKPGQSLADRHPEVAAIWHPTLNGDVTPADINPGSNTNRWWLCPRCGKDFKSTPHNRRKSPQLCPTCSHSHPYGKRQLALRATHGNGRRQACLARPARGRVVGPVGSACH
jgi:DNA-directed RNA polymerase subunit RPC12/RpoP